MVIKKTLLVFNRQKLRKSYKAKLLQTHQEGCALQLAASYEFQRTHRIYHRN